MFKFFTHSVDYPEVTEVMMEPGVMHGLVEDAMENVLDQALMDEIIAQEDVDKKRLTAAVKKLKRKS